MNQVRPHRAEAAPFPKIDLLVREGLLAAVTQLPAQGGRDAGLGSTAAGQVIRPRSGRVRAVETESGCQERFTARGRPWTTQARIFAASRLIGPRNQGLK